MDGWTSPLYQSVTQPHLQWGVSQRLCIVLLVTLMIGILWGAWWLVALTIVLYGVARIGTRYDAHFCAILLGHLQHHDHYEG